MIHILQVFACKNASYKNKSSQALTCYTVQNWANALCFSPEKIIHVPVGSPYLKHLQRTLNISEEPTNGTLMQSN
jgi:hypothetical protein